MSRVGYTEAAPNKWLKRTLLKSCRLAMPLGTERKKLTHARSSHSN
jgi:hypothetical protein